MAIEYGTALGLSQSGQYDQAIQGLRYNQYADLQAQQLAEKRASDFAELTTFELGMNPYDDAKMSEFAKQRIREIGQYYKNNPDVNWNPEKRAELKILATSLRNNPIKERGMQVKQHYNELVKDLQEAKKNPDMYDVQAMEDQLLKFQNYFKTGHEEGIDGITRDRVEKAPIYQRPQDFIDENELFMKAGRSMQARSARKINNGRVGAHEIFVPEEDLYAAAQSIYSAHKRQFDIRYTQKGQDPIKTIAASIQPYTPYKMDYGEEDTFGRQMALEQFKHNLKASGERAGASAYDISLLNTDKVVPGAEILSETFTSAPPAMYIGADGNVVPVDQGTDRFYYSGDLMEAGFGRPGYKGRTGIKEAPGYILKPLDWAEKQGFIDDPWGFSGDGETDFEVKPEFKDYVSIVDSPPNKNGETKKMVKVKAVARINANSPMYRNKFDANVAKLTTKQRDASGVVESSVQQSSGTYGGYPIGSVLNTAQGKYLVTANGFIPQ